MTDFFEKLKTALKKDLSILWIFGVALGLALVVLESKNKLPLGMGDFVFISILALCASLYRPRWAFYLFVSLVPMENIIVASGFLPMQLRPYQYVGVILIVAVLILWIFRHLPFILLKPTCLDWLVFSLAIFGFLSSIYSSFRTISLKHNLVILSFVALFYLTRNFVRTRKHLIETAFFFSASNIVVLAYGFFQVFADKIGANSHEVMFGRPNSTFTEPDWLGIYLCFALAVFLAILFFYNPERNQKPTEESPEISPARIVSLEMTKIAICFMIFLNLSLLILTLSRSAWIGATAVVTLFLIFSLYEKGSGGTAFTLRRFTKNFSIIFSIFLLSLATVHFGKLSKFDIFDRARSAATSEQKITISCESSVNVPQAISKTDELAKYNCRHIDLEEIVNHKSQGKFVTEIFRKDPNVMTRGMIYEKSWDVLKSRPFLGVGFGTISQLLGVDERGAGYNESNIFLQLWAGTGIAGLAVLISVFGYLFIHSFRRLSPICPLNKFFGCPIVRDDLERSLNVFLILGLTALIVPNLFNAGLFMGLIWIAMAFFISCALE